MFLKNWSDLINLTVSVPSRKVHIELVIAKIVMSLVFLWLLAWTPYAIVSLIGISGHGDLLTPMATIIPALFAKTSACINPFVYSLTHPKIKKELVSRLRCLNSSVSTNNSMTDSPIVHFKSRSYSTNQAPTNVKPNLVAITSFDLSHIRCQIIPVPVPVPFPVHSLNSLSGGCWLFFFFSFEDIVL